MKATALVLSALFVAATAAPAHAQLGALGKIKKGADKAIDTKQKIDDLTFSEAEERQIGEQVSAKLRERFGVYQDADVTKYVMLVGSIVAQASSKPKLDWKFIVLDSDGVNAYATPGGFIHVTRGLLGMLKNEAELAGVLGHEVTHVTERHTIDEIRRSRIGSDVTEQVGSSGWKTAILARATNKAFEDVFSGKFSQGQESDSDRTGVRIASKLGYSPLGLATALQKIADRNSGQKEPNGWFSSHPALKSRIENVDKQVTSEKLPGKALSEARYKQHIGFDAKALSAIPTVDGGASGLASGEKKKEDDKKEAKKDEPKKSRFGAIGNITGGGKQAQSSQQTASAGARGVGPDRDAKGGGNPAIVAVKVTAAEIEAFKKGIA
jgi:predicted Zn-dependent protease